MPKKFGISADQTALITGCRDDILTENEKRC